MTIVKNVWSAAAGILASGPGWKQPMRRVHFPSCACESLPLSAPMFTP